MGQCDFESGDFCGWINSETSDRAEWIIGQGRAGTEGTGPTTDHTLMDDMGMVLMGQDSERTKLLSTTVNVSHAYACDTPNYI